MKSLFIFLLSVFSAVAAVNDPPRVGGTPVVDMTRFLALSNSVVSGTAVTKMETNNGTAFRAIINRVINPQNSAYDAKGDGTTDDTTALRGAIAAASGGKFLSPPGLTYKITGGLLPPSNTILDGQGSTLHLTADTYAVVLSNVTNVKLINWNITHANGLLVQTPVRATNSTYFEIENITVSDPGLNGLELYHSSFFTVRNYKCAGAKTFGCLQVDCLDYSFYDSDFTSGSFCFEPKSCKRFYLYNVYGFSTNEYVFYNWTGFTTVPEIPAHYLSEDGVYEKCTGQGGPNTKHIFYINASPRITLRDCVAIPHPSSVWGAVAINSTSFYNEGSTISGNTTSSSASVTNVSDPDGQIAVGSRIHIAGTTGNFTVNAKSGTSPTITLTLNGNLDATQTGALIGFVSKSDGAIIEKLRIKGAGVGNDNLDIAGTPGDPLKGITLVNFKSETAPNFAINVVNADVTKFGGYFSGAAIQEINLSTGAVMRAFGTTYTNSSSSTTNFAVKVTNGALYYPNGCNFESFGVAVTAAAAGDLIYGENNTINNSVSAALVLQGKSSWKGGTIKSTGVNAGSFIPQVQVFGSNNIISGVTFDKGASTWVGNHIAEQTGATANTYMNSYADDVIQPVSLASGSTSIRLNPFDTRLNATTVTILTNTGILTGIVGTDANGKTKKATLSGATWDGNTLTITGGGAGDDVSVDGSATVNPNFDDGGDINFAYSSPNITATVKNDAVSFAKMQNIATDRLIGRDTAATGDPEELTVGGGLEFTGSGGIQTSAFTGDVTKSAGGTAQTIPNNTVTYAKMQDVSATSRALGRKTAGAGDPEELTLSELLDFIGSAAQGDILYRGASGWARLGAGTSGNFLQTQGAGANPQWAAGAGGGDSGQVNGSNVTDFNFTDAFQLEWFLDTTPSPDTIKGRINPTAVITNATEIGREIYLGTATNVVVDPLNKHYTWAPAANANCRFQFGTNTISATNYSPTVYIKIEGGAGQQWTNVVDSWTAKGNIGVLKAGLNTIICTWDAGRWFFYQDTAQQDATTIGGGAVTDTEFALLDGHTNPLLDTLNISDTAYNAGTWDAVTTIAPSKNAVRDELELKAYLASPTFTGDPKAPTATAGDNDTSIATTAFVATSFAPLASPAFTGNPTVPTASANDNDTSAASTAYVQAELSAYASDTVTVSNKRITARVTSISSSATPTVNTDNADCVTITALAAAITSMTTNLSGTPNNFDQLEYRIKDDGTARAITWGASFVAGPTALPTTTVVNKALHVYFEWDSVQSKWVCMSSGSDS
jgi:hypothetical protein